MNRNVKPYMVLLNYSAYLLLQIRTHTPNHIAEVIGIGSVTVLIDAALSHHIRIGQKMERSPITMRNMYLHLSMCGADGWTKIRE